MKEMAVNAQNRLARLQANLIKNEKETGYLEMATHSFIGGQRLVTLMIRNLYPAATGNCVSCDQHTVLGGNAMNANAATIGLLIPAAMIADTEQRAGYRPGNCGLFCRACVDASNDAAKNGRYFIWTADCVNAANVPLEWKPLYKSKNVKYAPIPAELQTESFLREYRKNAARNRARKGIVA
jgi:hypothetical protein